MILLPSYFVGFASKSDGSASLRFSTQELSSDDFKNLKDNHNAFGWLQFTENQEEAPDESPVREGKSPSERLHSRMFVFWKEKKIETPFNTWREQQLEKIGDKYLAQLR